MFQFVGFVWQIIHTYQSLCCSKDSFDTMPFTGITVFFQKRSSGCLSCGFYFQCSLRIPIDCQKAYYANSYQDYSDSETSRSNVRNLSTQQKGAPFQ
ncbi:unnamed protein product [Callosobruchus maculatus]|uniref:Uncharacterized protein n=1 Tax=Callosobruchus maculatus TaxID=64391 RepID=A0A653BG17_CALMS|nr:unnamed protein product [Callosobruchus maculatus]